MTEVFIDFRLCFPV